MLFIRIPHEVGRDYEVTGEYADKIFIGIPHEGWRNYEVTGEYAERLFIGILYVIRRD
ncbi:MAG: hypothetical protein WCQ70_06910 [Lentimicrobiaceae bacterium]